MKRFIVLTFIISAVLLCSGCAKLNINCGIDNDYNAFVEYDFALDTSEIPHEIKTSTQDFMSEIAQNYKKKLGYELVDDIYTKNDIVSFSLQKNIKCNSYEEAFDTLKSILTSEKETPFLNVKMDMNSSDFEKAFIFYADTDFEKIINTSDYKRFPEDIYETINDGLNDLSGFVTVCLPAHEYISVSEHTKFSENIATYTVPISLSSPTVLDISTKINLENNQLSGFTINQSIEQSQNKINFYIVLISLSAFIFLALAVVLIVVIVKKKKNSKAEEKIEEAEISEKIEEIKKSEEAEKTEDGEKDEDIEKTEETEKAEEVEETEKSEEVENPKENN